MQILFIFKFEEILILEGGFFLRRYMIRTKLSKVSRQSFDANNNLMTEM